MKLRVSAICSLFVSAVMAATSYAGAQAAAPARPPQEYDLLLKGGHVIDAKNNIDTLMDVAIRDGKIAKVAKVIPASTAIKTVNVTGMYVVPGLVDIHTHVYAGTGEKGSYAGDLSVYPDGFTLRNGVTTIVDAGSSGWRSFPDFKSRVIDISKTRVLAMLNIVGAGMRPNGLEQNTADMDGQKTGEMALKYPGVIVGIKSAHYVGPEWKPYEQAEIAGKMANIPVMIDFGARRIERPIYKLFEDYLRPGDIYTHALSGERGEQDNVTGGVGRGLREARAKGIYFDVGHGQASFAWSVVIPLLRDGFPPDSISSDLHVDSMNAGMKDMLNIGDKFLAIGWPLKDVIAAMTWHPAHEVKQDQLGNLSEGAIADVAVISMEHGHFGFGDSYNSRVESNVKMVCELTIKDGKFVYDLNAMTGNPWNQPPTAADKYASRWTTLKNQGFGESHWKPRPGQPLQHDWRPYTLPANELQTMQPGTANSVDPQWMTPEERAKSAEIDKQNAAKAAARTKALADSANSTKKTAPAATDAAPPKQ
jgi:dihydroorotase